MKYQSLFNINKEKQHNLIYTFQYDPYCFHFRTSLELLITNASAISTEILQAKFEEIMLYLLQKEPEKIRQLLASNVPDFEFQFKSIVENNIHSQLSLDELAFLCNMSISTFKRYFSQYYQTTPKKWFIAERMKTAAYLRKINVCASLRLFSTLCANLPTICGSLLTPSPILLNAAICILYGMPGTRCLTRTDSVLELVMISLLNLLSLPTM